MELDAMIQEYLEYGMSRQLRKKTLHSYEQALRMFSVWLAKEAGIHVVEQIREATLRKYVLSLQTRGKYTACSVEGTEEINHPSHRMDYGKTMSNLTINNYLRNLRGFFSWLVEMEYSSLNPRQTVEEVIREPLVLSRRFRNKSEIAEETDRLMKLVGIDERLRHAYPHELDGGRRQRVGIARALALNPEFIVCDEPVSALDVSIQAQVLNLLQDLQEKQGLTYIFVTHDLSVVRHISDDICVMYLGQLVETSPSKELFIRPLHPYTKALLSAIPSTDIHHPHEHIRLKGEITSPVDPKPGCRFAARCPYACDRCHAPQELRELTPNHFVSCCRAEEINGL